MKLAELISTEASTPLSAVLLLRHGNDGIEVLRRNGATIEEYTALQPVASKYDYLHPSKPPIEIVVVIVDDRVYGVYKVVGIEATGPSDQLASAAYLSFDAERGKSPRHSHRFQLRLLPSIATGQSVHGWEGRTRTPVQRLGGVFFDQVEIGTLGEMLTAEEVSKGFASQVHAALNSSTEERTRRLTESPPKPARVPITSFAFVRNPYVVAEVLNRANGVCQLCKLPAPFLRKSDATPYLEVHHRVQLAHGGDDTVENAVAICPNCHRRAHYGDA